MKFIAGAAAGALVAAGLTFAAPAATAAPPYGGKTQTTCAVAVIVKNNGKRIVIKPRIRVAGKGVIKGAKKIKLTKGKKNKNVAKFKLGKNKKRIGYKLPKKGKRFQISFTGQTGKKYKNCSTVVKFKR